MAGAEGIEPSFAVPKTAVLPLNDAPVACLPDSSEVCRDSQAMNGGTRHTRTQSHTGAISRAKRCAPDSSAQMAKLVDPLPETIALSTSGCTSAVSMRRWIRGSAAHAAGPKLFAHNDARHAKSSGASSIARARASASGAGTGLPSNARYTVAVESPSALPMRTMGACKGGKARSNMSPRPPMSAAWP